MVFRRSKSYGRSRPMRGYKSKTQVIAHNEARKVVKRAVSKNLEKKAFMGQQVYTIAPTTGVITTLFTDVAGSANMVSGTGGQQTVGEAIRPVKVEIRGFFNTNSTPANAGIRMVLVQCRGVSSVTMLDIFQSNTDFVISDYAQDQVGFTKRGIQLKVLYDRMYEVDTVGKPLVPFHIVIPAKKLSKVSFIAGTPDQITDGNLLLIIVSDNATSPARFKYFSTIWYTDA